MEGGESADGAVHLQTISASPGACSTLRDHTVSVEGQTKHSIQQGGKIHLLPANLHT